MGDSTPLLVPGENTAAYTQKWGQARGSWHQVVVCPLDTQGSREGSYASMRLIWDYYSAANES